MQNAVSGTAAGLMARGMDLAGAQSLATMQMAGRVARQGMVLAFDHLFLVGAVCFALILPLVMLFRRPKLETGAPAHIEME